MLIQRMRDGSEGVMAKIIIGLIVIVFALFGFGSITTFLAPVPRIATVNGEDITQQEMEMTVERRRRVFMAQGVPIDEDELREDVLEALVVREVLEQTADELDLHYGDAALDADIVSNDIFMLEGQFNAQQFQQVVRGAGYTPLSYRAEMRTDQLINQLMTGIQGSSFVTEEEAKRFSALLYQRRDLAYIQIPVTGLIDEVVVTDADIETYYNENLADFETQESVDLQYVELSRDVLAASHVLDEGKLQEFFDERAASYATAESRRVAHILIETAGEEAEDQTAERAQTVYDRIMEGEDFSVIAQASSDDLGSRENGGDLGFNTQGTFSPEFEAAAYELTLNQVSPPVKTEFGYHIIKLLGIQDAHTPGLEEVRAEVEQAYRYEMTEDEFVNLSSRMSDLLFQNYDEIESTANSLGLEVKSTGHLAKDASHPLMSNTKIAELAFSPDILVDGNNSDVVEIDADYHIGFRVHEHKPGATRPLVEARQDIEYILQRERAAELAKSRAEEIAEKIRGGSLAQFVADQHGVEWITAPAVDRFNTEIDAFVRTKAFKLPRPAETKESLDTAVLPNGDALVLRVSTVIDAPEDQMQEAEIESIQLGLARQFGAIDFNEFQNSVRGAADLERVN